MQKRDRHRNVWDEISFNLEFSQPFALSVLENYSSSAQQLWTEDANLSRLPPSAKFFAILSKLPFVSFSSTISLISLNLILRTLVSLRRDILFYYYISSQQQSLESIKLTFFTPWKKLEKK
jgi:hypothetical protein